MIPVLVSEPDLESQLFVIQCLSEFVNYSLYRIFSFLDHTIIYNHVSEEFTKSTVQLTYVRSINPGSASD